PTFADFENLSCGEIPAPLAHNLCCFEENFSALLRWRVAPLGKKARGFVDRLFSVFDRRRPYSANNLVGIGGIQRFYPRAAAMFTLLSEFATNLFKRFSEAHAILRAREIDRRFVTKYSRCIGTGSRPRHRLCLRRRFDQT